MRIKTFYAKTMSEALREIKGHLGPDALLLSTKEVPRRSGIWGTSSGFEVVAAVDDGESLDEFSSRLESGNAGGPSAHPARASAEMPVQTMTYSPVELLRKSARMQKRPALSPQDGLNRCCQAERDNPFRDRAGLSLYQDLVNSGVEASLAGELLLDAMDGLTSAQRRSRTALKNSISRTALNAVGDSSARDGLPGKKVVVVVGPTGVGKTTSIAKLAARLALQKKKKVILMTLDSYRIGAVEQLRSYAGLMGVPFRFIEQVDHLPRVIQENSQRDYVLIDTAGHGPRDLQQMDRLAGFLNQSEFIERHLVLSSATKSSDMRAAMDRFEICHPDHLLFTKLDETSTPGPILNELVRTQKSFSYYTDGQRVPDDLHTVSRDRIIDIVLGSVNNQNENGLKE